MNITYSLCPVVLNEVMQLFERVEVGGKSMFVPVNARILWLRSSETTVIYRHDGEIIREVGTLNDFYGFLSSLDCAMGDATSAAKRLKVGKADRLSVDLDVTITDTPVMEDNS